MVNLKVRQEKIQAKRKTTPRQEFVKDVCSRAPMVFHRNGNKVSKFPPTDRVTVVSQQQFYAARDDLTKHGLGIDPSKSFFSQFGELFQTTPLSAMMHRGKNENCDYVDIALNSRNGYLSIGLVTDVENILYSWSVKDYSKNVYNSVMVRKHCDNIFSCLSVINSFNIFYSKFIEDSSNIRFSSNLVGCQECLLCDNLQNQSYCIRNKVYGKDDYLAERENLLAQKEKFFEWMEQVNSHSSNFLSTDVTGNGIIEGEHIEKGYFIYNLKGGRNVFLGGSAQGAEEIYDCSSFGSPRANNVYGGYSINGEHIYCAVHSAGSSHIFYCYYMENCAYCLGCVGLINKQFCIFNKQYTKEEWHMKVDEIFSKMEQDGVLGAFFPGSINPFYFNDTAAHLIDDTLTKEEMIREWYLWRDQEVRVDIPEGSEVVQVSELEKFETLKGDQRFIDPTILKKVIVDHKGDSYRVVQMEYDFLMKYGLPIPRLHRLDRIKGRLKIIQ